MVIEDMKSKMQNLKKVFRTLYNNYWGLIVNVNGRLSMLMVDWYLITVAAAQSCYKKFPMIPRKPICGVLFNKGSSSLII